MKQKKDQFSNSGDDDDYDDYEDDVDDEENDVDNEKGNASFQISRRVPKAKFQ